MQKLQENAIIGLFQYNRCRLCTRRTQFEKSPLRRQQTKEEL